MQRGLWLIRLLLLVAVSAVVFSPLVVHGEAATPRPLDFDLEYDASALALPSSPTYPAVTAYREVRLSLSDGQCEKARASLSFANDDAAAIMEMVKREQYIEAVQHSSVFRESFDLSVGWTVIAGQNRTNVSSLLGQLKNDHARQQVILAQASAGLPLWANDTLESSRQHAATVLLEAVGLLQGHEEAEAYRRTLAEVCPDLDLGENEPRAEVGAQPDTGQEPTDDTAPDIVVVTSEDEADTSDTTDTSAVGPMPDIASLSISPSVLAPGETCAVSCNLAAGSRGDLEYTWSCGDGELDATGATAVWKAPSDEGTYEVSVEVLDSNGNSDEASIEVRVRDSSVVAEDDTPDSVSPPKSPAPDQSASAEILGLSVDADHGYLSHSVGDSYSILVGRSCTISCEVSDPDLVSFEWTANGGEITGDGDTVTWTAPKTVGNLKLTVTVTNGEGQKDSAVLNFYCTTCSQCF
ncbi:MAG: PKD domain-containing protein [Chloroflexota bacterium]